ncbi:aspartate/glutamate racemase family protein [Streptomyces sp. NPDC057363]|uniref:aspartate/glutamate racemase family protein n=1 Tax=Streptomyces sp. NPDC057363 TaxID=3346107 RepID=UPI0036273C30
MLPASPTRSPGRSVRKSAPGCRYEEAPTGPGMPDAFGEATGDGAEAVFVSCFGGDPGVRAAREIVDIPVVGGFGPAVLPSLALGERTGVITVLSSTPRGLRSCGWSLRCGWGCDPATQPHHVPAAPAEGPRRLTRSAPSVPPVRPSPARPPPPIRPSLPHPSGPHVPGVESWPSMSPRSARTCPP